MLHPSVVTRASIAKPTVNLDSIFARIFVLGEAIAMHSWGRMNIICESFTEIATLRQLSHHHRRRPKDIEELSC